MSLIAIYTNPKMKYNEKKWKNIFLISLVIIILISITVRIYDLNRYTTNVDDIGVAVSILDSKDSLSKTWEYMYNNTNLSYKEDGYNNLKFSILWKIDHVGMLKPIIPLANKIIPFIIIPMEWTYAPIQFIITAIFLSNNQTYHEILFWGRLPSLLFNIFAIILLIYFYKKYSNKEYYVDALLAITIIALSWENIIYSKQMESYSIGIFSLICIMILLTKQLSIYDVEYKYIITYSAILAILNYTQYQILLFIPAYFLTLLIYYYNTDKNIKHSIKKIILGGSIYFIIAIPLIIVSVAMSNMSTHWNAGPNQEFVLDGSLLQKISNFSHTIYFFIKNWIIVFFTQVSAVSENSILFIPLNTVFLILATLGAISFFINKDKKKKYIGLFILTSMLIWTALIFLGKLALSPTRHTLILLPLFVILIVSGWRYLIETIAVRFKQNKNILYKTTLILCIVIISCFILSFNEATIDRKDKFDDKQIQKVLEEYNIQTVIGYNMTWNVFLMKDIKSKYPILLDGRQGSWITDNSAYKKERIAFISQRNPIYPEQFNIRMREIWTNDTKEYYEYNMILKQEISSSVSVEFSNRTEPGTNGYYIYIFYAK